MVDASRTFFKHETQTASVDNEKQRQIWDGTVELDQNLLNN